MLKAQSIKQKAFDKAVSLQHAGVRKTRVTLFTLLSAFSFQPSALILLLALTSGCSFNPNLQGKGQDYLQGQWQQDTVPIQQKLVTFSRYSIRFACDSFYLQMNNYSRVNYGQDSCIHNGRWAEYVKGNYQQKNDTLFLKGLYCNADFTYKTDGACFNTGPYKEFFKITKITDSVVQLQGTSSVIPVKLKLLKRTICHQKPL